MGSTLGITLRKGKGEGRQRQNLVCDATQDSANWSSSPKMALQKGPKLYPCLKKSFDGGCSLALSDSNFRRSPEPCWGYERVSPGGANCTEKENSHYIHLKSESKKKGHEAW